MRIPQFCSSITKEHKRVNLLCSDLFYLFCHSGNLSFFASGIVLVYNTFRNSFVKNLVCSLKRSRIFFNFCLKFFEISSEYRFLHFVLHCFCADYFATLFSGFNIRHNSHLRTNKIFRFYYFIRFLSHLQYF